MKFIEYVFGAKHTSGYMKKTIQDVAKRAGVSVGSVSRVFRQHPTVTPEVASAVRKAAEDLGYTHPTERRRQPHGLPVSLRRVALLTVGMAHSLSRLPVVAELLEGALEEARARDLSVTMLDAPDLASVPKVLRDREVDGVLLKAGLQGTAEQWHSPLIKAATALPHVWLEGRPEGAGGDMVGSDSVGIGRLAAERLLSRGHRRLAFLSPKDDHQLFLERQGAFTWHAERAGATVKAFVAEPKGNTLPVQAPEDVAVVSNLLNKLLSGRERPTAVFVPSDTVAVLLYRAMMERKVKPGKDLAVISCNHERLLCDGLSPALTTIDIHVRSIGGRALDQLYWRAARPDEPLSTTVIVSPDLVEGKSA